MLGIIFTIIAIIVGLFLVVVFFGATDTKTMDSIRADKERRDKELADRQAEIRAKGDAEVAKCQANIDRTNKEIEKIDEEMRSLNKKKT